MPRIAWPGWANALSIARILVVFPLCALLAAGHVRTALFFFIAGALSDAADGALARRLGETSDAGALLDFTADKIFFCGVLLGIFLLEPPPFLFVVLAYGLIAREFFMMALRITAANKGRTLGATKASKTKTALGFTALGGFFFPGYAGFQLFATILMGIACALAWQSLFVQYSRLKTTMPD